MQIYCSKYKYNIKNVNILFLKKFSIFEPATPPLVFDWVHGDSTGDHEIVCGQNQMLHSHIPGKNIFSLLWKSLALSMPLLSCSRKFIRGGTRQYMQMVQMIMVVNQWRHQMVQLVMVMSRWEQQRTMDPASSVFGPDSWYVVAQGKGVVISRRLRCSRDFFCRKERC